MKKLFLLLIALSFIASCSMDDGSQVNFHVEFLPVESVEMAEYFSAGQTYEVTVKYRNPTDCHYFDGFYYETEGHVTTIAVQAIVIEDSNCQSMMDLAPVEEKFQFYCDPAETAATGFYTFRFYNGEDANGQQTFYEVQVPVTQ